MLQPERISYWKNKPKWAVWELVYLLHEIEPMPTAELTEAEQSMIKAEIKKWAAWVYGCPIVPSIEMRPMTTPYEKMELLKWAQSLDGVEIPEYLADMLDTTQPQVDENLGKRERMNLEITIGLLVKVVASTGGNKWGDPESPNVKQIAEACQKHSGKISGMSLTSLRQRISKGLNILTNNL